jgi:uncharacterized protein YjbK
MIEIERKILLTEDQLDQLEKQSRSSQEVSFLDVYYDTKDYHLTGQNMWLRKREDRFELKRKVKDTASKNDIYEELVRDQDIKQAIGISADAELAQALPSHRIAPFCHLKTIRKSLALELLHLDIDICYEKDFTYRVAEIEFLVQTQDEIPMAEKKIEEWLSKQGLQLQKKPRGKLIEYLFQKRPDHYHYLKHMGVISY